MSSLQEERIPEEDNTAEAPLTMAASVVLTNLPRDASKALESAGNLAVQKSKWSWNKCTPAGGLDLALDLCVLSLYFQ
jgi:hypothetical protein